MVKNCKSCFILYKRSSLGHIMCVLFIVCTYFVCKNYIYKKVAIRAEECFLFFAFFKKYGRLYVI